MINVEFWVFLPAAQNRYIILSLEMSLTSQWNAC